MHVFQGHWTSSNPLWHVGLPPLFTHAYIHSLHRFLAHFMICDGHFMISSGFPFVAVYLFLSPLGHRPGVVVRNSGGLLICSERVQQATSPGGDSLKFTFLLLLAMELGMGRLLTGSLSLLDSHICPLFNFLTFLHQVCSNNTCAFIE